MGLSTVSWLSLFSNSGLLAFTLGSFDNPPQHIDRLPNWVFFLFFVFAMSAMKLALAVIIPDLPDRVRIAEEHQAWIRQEVDIAASGDDAESAWRNLGKANVLTLDLTIDTSAVGQLRDPLDFGMSESRLQSRAKAIRQRHIRAS